MELVRFSKAQRVLRAAAVALAVAFAVLPLLWLVAIAVRPATEAVFPISIIPSSFTLDNIAGVLFGKDGIGLTPYGNAAIYGLSSAVITAVASTLGGYALARYDLRAGEALLIVILALSFLPAASRIVPLFILFSASGLYGTSQGVILAYAAGSIPLGIWLMAGTFRQIPIRLEQAARIDGAGALMTMRRVVLPLAIPGILVVATLAFIDGWNSFSLPLILIPKDNVQPYTVALQRYIQEVGFGINWPLLSAGSLVALVPVLTIFALLQRRLVRVGGLGGAIRG
ncbi:MAG: carbohydrate ABC transporter permease [Candidatus Limnocylindrales bacterium]